MHTNRFFILIVDQCLKIHLLDKPHQPLYNGLFNGIYCKPTHLQVACVVWIWRNKFLSGNTNMLRDFEKIAIICLFMLIKKHVFANLKKFSTKSNFQTFCISLYILYIKNAKFMLLQSDFQSPPENKPTNFFFSPIRPTLTKTTCCGQPKFNSHNLYVNGFFQLLIPRESGLRPMNEATTPIHGERHIHCFCISSWIKIALRYSIRHQKNSSTNTKK